MAIVKMRKLNLVGLSYDKDAVLNALHKTNATEITLHAYTDNTVALESDTEGMKSYLAAVENALGTLCSAVEAAEKANGEKKPEVLKDGFDVAYSDFIAAKESKANVDATVEKINALTDEKNKCTAELARVRKQIKDAEIYADLKTPFAAFADTQNTRARLGIIPAQNSDGLEKSLAEIELCSMETLRENGDYALVFVVAHKSVVSEVDGALSTFGFTVCPHKGNKTGEKVMQDLQAEERSVLVALEENERGMYALKDEIRPMKIYCDYCAFTMEKEETSDKLRATEKTFLLQAYVPVDAEECVKEQLVGLENPVYFEFSDPADEETPPTLMRNNAIVSNFEGITNTYSAPHYREFDPNAVMAFFYSLFMGFIIGDAGYGLIMLLGGGILWWKGLKRPTGTSRLAGAFAVGGIFAIFWGLLFNSLFGFAPFAKAVMPDPQKGRCTLVGIQVPSVLLICMELGVFQLCAGYVCKAVQEWRRGNFFDGICDGVLWAIFSIGVGMAIVGLVAEMNLPKFALIGGLTAGISLALAVVLAGRHEKSFGKLTKSFGSLYGIINYASDILSYARLYGLMLSGAVIAQIIATYSGGFIVSGNVLLIVLGVVLLLIGNAFNLIMNLLGAYIHDARLQYVEFYGRFFEGEGELFTPLGASRKYIYLLPAQNQ